MDIQYVVNPKTGRHIKVGGPTYSKLVDIYQLESAPNIMKSAPKAKYPSQPVPKKHMQAMSQMPLHQYQQSTGKGKHTRGWGEVAPKRGQQRHLLKEKCGDKCFLMPEQEAFPICPKCSNQGCQCQIDCRGLTSAKIRAAQYKYHDVANAAKILEKKVKCRNGGK